MKIIDYFAVQERPYLSLRFFRLGVELSLIAVLAGYAWFYSSFVALPVYLLFVVPKGSASNGFWMLGGAVMWYVIVFLLIYISFFVVRHSKRGKAMGL